MDIIFLKTQFVFLFFIYSFVFYKLIKRGFSFSLGLTFGFLYFIFIPLVVLVFTNEVEISRIDFGGTIISDVNIKEIFFSSLLLIGYMYSFLIYVLLAEFIFINRYLVSARDHFILNWKAFFFLWLFLAILIFYLAGIHEGGHWYKARDAFREDSRIKAILLGYVLSASKIMLIAVLLTLYKIKKISIYKFILVGFVFSLIDMFLTGNRIFVFIFFAGFSIILMQKYRWKTLFFSVAVIPFGYLMSIYQRMRGRLFLDGIPSLPEVYEITKDTVLNYPPQITEFLLGISESVNLNVIYMIFNSVSLNNMLFGSTYIKPFIYFIPRSIWPEKPLSITQIAGEWFAPNAGHLSLVTTIIGEMHMNFYLLGLVLMPILLFFTNRLLHLLFTGDVFKSVFLFLIGLLIFRMSFSDIILYALFCYLLYSLFSVINISIQSIFK